MTSESSYLVEAQAERRRRLAVGVVGAVMLAAAGLSVLLVYDGATMPVAEQAAQQANATAESADGLRVSTLR